MPGEGPLYHFAISLGIAILAAAGCSALRPESGGLAVMAFALLAALTAGQAKELADLAQNPWSLAPAELRADSARDMGWNLAGAAAGALLGGIALAARPRSAKTEGQCPGISRSPPRARRRQGRQEL